jgi:uncharacterized protein YecT (DUF1311 family)
MSFPRRAGSIAWWTLLVACLVLPRSGARAASFDCAKAAAPIEKRICADAAISEADSALGQAFAETLSVDLDRTGLREEQQRWLAGRDGARDLLAAYRDRIVALHAIAGDWRTLPGLPGPAALEGSCYATPASPRDGTCEVEESGVVKNAPDLFYQVQGNSENGVRMDGAVLVFRRAGGTNGLLRPIAGAFEEQSHFSQPERIRIGDANILWLPGSIEGTGFFNAERLYGLTAAGDVEEIDTGSWQHDLARRLPKGLAANKGIYPDYGTLVAETELWRGSDANCCPTGGHATIRLSLAGHRFVIASLSLGSSRE